MQHPASTYRQGIRGGKDKPVAVLNSIELEGVSESGWREAAQEAVREASKTLRNIRRIEVLGTSAVVDGEHITEYRAQVRLTFEVETVR